MRKTFTGMALLLVLVVVVQFFLAAAGAFSDAPKDESFKPHLALGYVVFFLPLLMALVAWLARLPGRFIGMVALVAVLDSVQVGIAEVARAAGDDTTAGRLIFGLHAVNGLAIMAVAATVCRRALNRG
jgi:hypothetical protein